MTLSRKSRAGGPAFLVSGVLLVIVVLVVVTGPEVLRYEVRQVDVIERKDEELIKTSWPNVTPSSLAGMSATGIP